MGVTAWTGDSTINADAAGDGFSPTVDYKLYVVTTDDDGDSSVSEGADWTSGTPLAVSGLTVVDDDTTNAGVDGWDFSVNWTVSDSQDVISQDVDILADHVLGIGDRPVDTEVPAVYTGICCVIIHDGQPANSQRSTRSPIRALRNTTVAVIIRGDYVQLVVHGGREAVTGGIRIDGAISGPGRYTHGEVGHGGCAPAGQIRTRGQDVDILILGVHVRVCGGGRLPSQMEISSVDRVDRVVRITRRQRRGRSGQSLNGEGV